jgi:hypothetical protein
MMGIAHYGMALFEVDSAPLLFQLASRTPYLAANPVASAGLPQVELDLRITPAENGHTSPPPPRLADDAAETLPAVHYGWRCSAAMTGGWRVELPRS